MKNLLLAFLILSPFFAGAQLNTKVYDELKSEDILIGECTPEGFRNGICAEWFNKEYDSFEVNESVFVEEYQAKFDSVIVVLGTWCGDTRREVPRFCKIMDHDYFKATLVKYYSVDGAKKTDAVNTEELYIQFVPTMIFYYGGNELCRIVETPHLSLEEDIMDLLSRIQP
jgi:hypothetical protein